MKSWEVLKEATEGVGVKTLAARLKLSHAMVYKWCQESPKDEPDASGARNPLDRLAEIIEVTGHIEIANWLCRQAGGFFVHNPKAHKGRSEPELLRQTQVLVREFSELLMTVTKSVQDDGQIHGREAESIRRKWDALKTTAESFVVACETGCYHDDPQK